MRMSRRYSLAGPQSDDRLRFRTGGQREGLLLLALIAVCPVAVLGHFELTAQGCILIDAWDLGVEQQTVDGPPGCPG